MVDAVAPPNDAAAPPATDAVAHGRVVGELGDDHAAVGVADEADRAIDGIDDIADVSSISVQIAQRFGVGTDAWQLVDHDDVVAALLDQRNDVIPVPSSGSLP